MLMGQMIPYFPTTTLYSPPFARGGESGTFYIDPKVVSGSPTLVVTIETKNTDETTWGTAGTFPNITATGLASKTVSSGLKEMIRFAYSFSAGSTGDWLWCEYPAPMWQVF